MLPLGKNDKIAVFGRTQFHHYKSGTGSGGKVNTEYSTSLYESMKDIGLAVNREIAQIYMSWIGDNPYDYGDGWVEPCAQREMPVKKAVIIIGRTAGEDTDNNDGKGSYLLSDEEYEMIKNVSEAFKEVCVLLNTGNIIDMKWVRELNVSAVMYIWHGGQEGGRAAAELLCGKRFPSGHLSDTIACDISDYPSFNGFENTETQKYTEDIFVGYRYFETFAPEKVLYPFGFGLSYTRFSVKVLSATVCGGEVSIEAEAENIGEYSGMEVVQVYFGVENSVVSRPKKALAAFRKTKVLKPGEKAVLSIRFNISDMAAYDDTGITGNKACYVLEKGDYAIYVGTSVQNAEKVLTYVQESTAAAEKLSPILPLAEKLERLVNKNGKPFYEKLSEAEEKHAAVQSEYGTYTGDKGIKLADVYYGKASIEAFAAQLSDFDLACLSQGEGMNSPKVRPGTGGAIGGLTPTLRSFGIPPICVTDGPSGLRFDNGDIATCMPNGTLLACTWNPDLTELLYTYEGAEAYANDVDALLGPGINIHRLPLCGRNFEYMSEDPYLAGTIAAAVCKGLKNGGITATVKHFSANNKERNRKKINMVISERALREIYLRPFEIAVKGGNADMVMTAYNMINGVFCSASEDLNTTVLRGEWGFKGLVMTDWWPNTHKSQSGEFSAVRKYPILAQNDLFMVNDSAEETAAEILKDEHDNEQLKAALRRNAVNILKTILKTPSFEKSLFRKTEDFEESALPDELAVCAEIHGAAKGREYNTDIRSDGDYICRIDYSADCADIIQLPIHIIVNGEAAAVLMIRGTENKMESKSAKINLKCGENVLALDYSKNITIHSLKLLHKKP